MHQAILLMAEILHYEVCIQPLQQWEILSIKCLTVFQKIAGFSVSPLYCRLPLMFWASRAHWLVWSLPNARSHRCVAWPARKTGASYCSNLMSCDIHCVWLQPKGREECSGNTGFAMIHTRSSQLQVPVIPPSRQVRHTTWNQSPRGEPSIGSPGCLMTPIAAVIQLESTWEFNSTIRHTQCSVVIQQCHLLSEITTCPSSFNMMLPEGIASASHAQC